MTDAQLVLALSLLAGLLSLDATAVLQVMLSQPLAAAGLAGLVAGDPALGLTMGAALQLVWIGALPVGAAPFPDGAVAGVAGVGATVLLSGRGVPGGLAIASGAAIGLIAGAVGQRVTAWVRDRNVRYADLALRRAEIGDPSGVRAAVSLGIATRFATAAVLAAAFLCGSLLLGPLASVRVGGSYPTALWAAPIAATALVVGGQGWEKGFVAAGLVVGLAISVMM